MPTPAERSRSDRRLLLWLNRVVWTLLVSAVILLGSIVSLGRYFLPNLESHQQQLVAAFNRRTNLQLSIGHLSGNWQHLSPHFIIDDLRLSNPHDPQQAVLRIAHVELQLGLFRSVSNGTIAISRLQGSGVRMQLEEATLGHWQLTGFGGPSALSFDRVIDFLAAIYRAELSDSIIDLHFFGGGAAQLTGQTLRLQRAADFRRLNLELTFADSMSAENRATEKAAPLRVVLETHGDPRANNFSGNGYVEFRSIDLTPVLPAAKAFGINLEHGRIDGTTWFSWRAGDAFEARGKIEVPQLDLAGVSKLTLAPVKNIKTEFFIRDYPEGHQRAGRRQLWLKELTGTWHDVALTFPQLSAIMDSAQPQRAQLALPELQLAPLAEAALADGNLPAHLRDVLSALAPQGTLRNVQLDLPLQPDHLDALRLRALLQTISVQPWQGAPGISNASGYVDGGVRTGYVDLISENFGMTFPHVYHEPLHFDKARGQIGWRLDSERVLVDSGPIAVQSDAGRATAQFALDLPLQHGPTPLMTLQVGLQNSAAQYRDRFIPYTLQPSLLQWLQRAIGKGEIPIGGFIYRGSLLANDHLNNTVQLFLHVRAADLAYQPEWPPLRDVRAAVWLDDGNLHVDVPSARIYDRITLRNGEVNLQHEDDVSWLTVNANAQGDNDDVLRLLRETPLRKQIGAAFDSWHWRGPTQSQVRLGIAVSGSRPQEISVDSHLNGGTLDLAAQNIVLEDVRGDLSYHENDHKEKGLRADALTAKWFGKPVEIKVATADDGDIVINAQGRVAMIDLKRWLNQPLFDYASGETPFAAALRIAKGTTTLQVNSDLQGAEIELPPPYRKTAEQVLPLNLAMDLSHEPNLTATLSDWVDLHLRWGKTDTNTTQLTTGVVRLGQTGKVVLNNGQFNVTGAVDSTDLSAWQTLIRGRAAAAPSVAADEDSHLAVQIREVHFNNAQIAGQALHDLVVSGRRDSAAWTVQMRAEQIAGTLTVPDNTALPWRAQLNYLRLPASAQNVQDEKNSIDNDSPIAQADPRNAAAIDVRIDHLWRGDEEFGWIEAQLRPLSNGLRLEGLKGQLRAVKIEARDEQPASLTWTRDGETDRSEFSGRLSVDDIGIALQRWHYEPVLTSKRGHADIELQWPGRPDQFKFVQADGKSALRFDDGRFLRASGSTTGALKVVGVFNFANFLRRLQLNFSDIFKDGVSFDEMQGALSTQHGVLNIDQPVEIKSPSSRFRLGGQIDFNRDQTDMELVATLPVASNLPWVAALTGALPAAAGLYVAGKVFESQFDKFSSASYQISGPLADPQVKLRKVFDDQLPKKSELPQKAAEEAAP